MAVSYASQVFRNTPLTPPVDLDLLSKVLGYKQSLFDQNFEKIQSQIDQANSLDVIKDEDRQYLNNKVNNLVNNINNLGGVDLGDLNISNQIEAYGSDIYNDDKVINAVASTKKIRNLQASYEKYRTDPKLTKYFSDANYTIDMANVSNYLNDGQVGSAYQGNSSATPFYDYNKEFQDVFKNKVANEYSQITPDGYYIRKSDGKYISADEVAAEARGLMSGNARSQMERDATYLYHYKAGWGKDQVINKALEVDVNSISDTQGAIDKLKSDIAIEQDPKSKIQLKKNLQDLQTSLDNQTKTLASNRVAYSNLYDQNPSELMYKGFSDDYFKSLGLRYSYSQVKNDLTADQVKLTMFNANERRYLKQVDIDAAKDLLNTKLDAEKNNLILEYQLKGQLQEDKFDLSGGGTGTGNGTGTGGIGGGTALFDIQPNTETGKEEDIYNAAKERWKTGIDADVNKAFDDVWSSLVANNVELQSPEFLNSQSLDAEARGYWNAGINDKPSWWKQALGYIGTPGFEHYYTGDNKTTPQKKTTSQPASTLDFDKSGQVNLKDFQMIINGKPAYEYIKDQKARAIVANAVQALKDMADKKPVNVTKIPKGIGDFYEKVNILNQERKQLLTGIMKYEGGDHAYLRNQFGNRIIPTTENIQSSPAISAVRSYLISNKLTGTANPIITEAGRRTDGTPGYTVTFADKNSKDEVTVHNNVPIPDNIATALGVTGGPFDVLNTTVTKDDSFKTTLQNKNDPTFAANIRVFKNGNYNEYGVKYELVTKAPNGQLIPQEFDLPLPPGATVSAAAVYAEAKNIIENFGYNLEDKSNLRDLFDKAISQNQ